MAGLLLTDNLSVLEEQAGGREEADNLTFVDRTDMYGYRCTVGTGDTYFILLLIISLHSFS